MSVPVVLASSSPYRARVLRDAGWQVAVAAPHVDEASLRHLFAALGPERYALDLAGRKARSVLGEVDPASIVIGADQVGVRSEEGAEVEVGKPGSLDEAVGQIMAVAGRSYRLVNGVVAVRAVDGFQAEAVDVHVVHVVDAPRSRVEGYVRSHRPLDVVGGCRIEDPSGLIDRVEGSGPSGVMGMPLDVVDMLVSGARPL